MKDLEQVFGQEGLLRKQFPNYSLRHAQFELAQEIAQTIESSTTLVAEAGTGIGKTWAYLVPALLQAKKVLVSTGTRTLQDQLYEKDLPQICQALGVAAHTAVLKGRANYVCHYHLNRVNEEPGSLSHKQQVVWLRDITRFAAGSATGDKAQLPTVPEDADVWRLVTSTRESCLGQECPYVSECFVYKARRQAMQADLVVINHALFMADAALRDEGVSDLLPQVDLIVFDEAHQLPDVATRFLAESVSSAQLQELAHQTETSGLAHARETVDWGKLCAQLTLASRELRLACDWLTEQSGQRTMRDRFLANEESTKAANQALQSLQDLVTALDQQAERHTDLALHLKQALSLQERLHLWVRGQSLEGSTDAAGETVSWAELTPAHVRLNSAPLSVAKAFSRERQSQQAWVFLSATLSVKGDFQYFTSRLGLEEARTVRHPSPFDYSTQALLCVPTEVPLSNHPEFHVQFVDYLMPLIQANNGSCLILCTTLRAIDQVGEALRQRFSEQGMDWPVLRQGQQSRASLLAQFRKEPRAVLIGSASFREGVDLAGDHLTLLAIDKLPFAPPDDPVLQARIRLCREQHGNPFMELQIPEAAIALKQGAGRLIRSERDWGVLVVGDRRLVEKKYGRQLWQGLPPFQRTREQEVVLEFIRNRRQPVKEPQADG